MVAFTMAVTSAFKWLNTDALPPSIQIVIVEIMVAAVGHALDHAVVVQDQGHEETAGADQIQDPGHALRGEVTANVQGHVMIKNPDQNPGVPAGPDLNPEEMTVNPDPGQSQEVMLKKNPDLSQDQNQDLGKDLDQEQRKI